MMSETAKIAGFGNYRKRIDRPDGGDLAQELIILAVPQQLVGLRFMGLTSRIPFRPALSLS